MIPYCIEDADVNGSSMNKCGEGESDEIEDAMKDLLRSGWSHDPRHRPDVTTVFDIISRTYLTLKEKKVARA